MNLKFLAVLACTITLMAACGGGGGSSSPSPNSSSTSSTSPDTALIGTWNNSLNGTTVTRTIYSDWTFADAITAPTYSCSETGRFTGDKTQVTAHTVSSNCPSPCYTDVVLGYTVDSTQLGMWVNSGGCSVMPVNYGNTQLNFAKQQV